MRHSKSSAFPFKELRAFSASALPTCIASRQPIRPFPEGGRSGARNDTIRAKCANSSTHSVQREGPCVLRPAKKGCAQLVQTAKHLPATAIAPERLQPARLTGAASDRS
jgi:hypothetical protein